MVYLNILPLRGRGNSQSDLGIAYIPAVIGASIFLLRASGVRSALGSLAISIETEKKVVEIDITITKPPMLSNNFQRILLEDIKRESEDGEDNRPI